MSPAPAERYRRQQRLVRGLRLFTALATLTSMAVYLYLSIGLERLDMIYAILHFLTAFTGVSQIVIWKWAQVPGFLQDLRSPDPRRRAEACAVLEADRAELVPEVLRAFGVFPTEEKVRETTCAEVAALLEGPRFSWNRFALAWLVTWVAAVITVTTLLTLHEPQSGL